MNRIVVPEHLRPVLERASQQSGIPVAVLAATFQHESSWNPTARGRAGERGMAQIMPSTAAQPGYGLRPLDLTSADRPEEALPWAANYMAARARSAGVNNWNDPAQVVRGLAAYNGAGEAAQQYGRHVAGLAGLGVAQAPVQASRPMAAPVPLEAPLSTPFQKVFDDGSAPAPVDDVNERVLRALRMWSW